MRSNNLTNYNEIKTLVLPATTPDTTIKLFTYISGTTKTPLSFTVTVIGSFKYIDFTTPNFDCHILVTYEGGSEFIRVGKPPIFLMLKYIKYGTEQVTYTQYDFNSNVLNTGNLVSIGDDFYVSNNISIVKSFYVVMGGIVTLTLPNSYYAICDYNNGTVLLERGKWQLVALPISGKVKEDFVDKIALQEGVLDTSLIEVCSAYPGHIDKFLSYIPGFTLPTSQQNFDLYYIDNGNKEITAFWVKCKNWTHTTNNILFKW